MTTFGPQLVGETEKTLQALLRMALADSALDERQWVTLRLSAQPDDLPLTVRVATRAHFPDADELVATLENRGLVSAGAATDAGQAMLTTVLAKSAALSGPIWDDIEDADAAARALTVVLARARAALHAAA